MHQQELSIWPMRSSPLLSFAAPCAQGLVLTPPQISPNFHSLKTFPHLPTYIAPSLGCWAACGPVKGVGWEVFGVRRAAQSCPGAEAGPPFCGRAWGGSSPATSGVGSKLPLRHEPFPQGTTGHPGQAVPAASSYGVGSLRGGRVALGRNGHAAGPPPHAGGHAAGPPPHAGGHAGRWGAAVSSVALPWGGPGSGPLAGLRTAAGGGRPGMGWPAWGRRVGRWRQDGKSRAASALLARSHQTGWFLPPTATCRPSCLLLRRRNQTEHQYHKYLKNK